jgi:hypothetical protein
MTMTIEEGEKMRYDGGSWCPSWFEAGTALSRGQRAPGTEDLSSRYGR